MNRKLEKMKQTKSSKQDTKSTSFKPLPNSSLRLTKSTAEKDEKRKSFLEIPSQPSASSNGNIQKINDSGKRKRLQEEEKSMKSNKSLKKSDNHQVKLIPSDLDKLVEKFKKVTDDYFIYLTYTDDESSKHFTPYNLAEVPFTLVDKRRFFTMSRHGVMFWTTNRKEMYITNLDDWYRQYQNYCKLVKIGTIKKFLLYKIFTGWRRFIQRKKFVSAQNFIKENLFFVIPDLAKSILALRKEWYYLTEVNFINVTLIEEWHLFYFIETQMELLEKVGDELQKFRQQAKLILYQGGLKLMTSKGFNPYVEITSFALLYKLSKFCQLFLRFLKYCDFMVISLLNLIARNSFKDLAMIFEKHNKCSPNIEDILNNTSLDVELEKPRPKSLPQNPLFIAELVLKTEKVEVDPSETIMMNTLVQLMDLIFETILKIEPFTNDSFFLQLMQINSKDRILDRSSTKPPDLNLVLNYDEELKSYRSFVLETVRRTYEKAEAYIQRFEQIRKSYEEDVNTDRKLIQAEGDIQALRNYCERYHKNMQNLEGILSTVNLGLLKLKQNTFKNVVTPVCRDLLNVLENYIPRLAIEEVKITSEKTNELMEKITAIPTNTVEYVNFLRFLKNAKTIMKDIFKELDYAHALFIILKDFGFSIEQEEKEKFMDCEDMAIECKEMLHKNRKKKQEIIEKLAKAIHADIRIMFEQVREVVSEVQDPKFMDKNSDPKVIKSQLDVLADRLNQCHQQAQNLKTYQKEFKIEVTRFDELDRALQEVRNRQNLWNGVIEWETSLNKWQNADFFTLDVEEMKQINTKILNMCTQFERSLPSNELVPALKESIETFKEKLPILSCLRNPSLKVRHWSLIEQILQRKLYQQEDITMNVFDEANVYEEDVASQVMEIAYQASEEARAESKLKEIENTAQKTKMSVVQHKDVQDAYILAGIDELQTIIDDINVNVNNLAASRHIELIKPEVDKWLGLTEQVYKTLDELQTCQTNWMYLQAIFSAPDIQRQIPQEARIFAEVDKKWKELMTKAYRMNQTIPFLGNTDHYEILKQNNNLLEMVTKRLEAYLEVKRTAFPRFFFLSNDELLEILAETRNPHAVQPFLMKCFDAIARIEFGSLQEGGDGGKVIETNDIVAMISPEGERLEFGKGLKARGAVEDWLSKVEEAMFIAVKRYMKFGYQTYPTKKRHEWFKDHPNQVVLTVSQQQWAAEIHSIFEKPDRGSVLKSMKNFQQKSLKELSMLAAITREDIPRLLRKVLCALITIDVHAKDTVANLVEKNVTNANDFNWLKMLRYYWRNDNDTVTTKMASASIPYYYEYLGAGGVLVITPLTDRCYLCLTGALQMDLGGAPAGPAGTGKTETTKDLAKALAKQCVVFNCSEGLDFKMMGRFFTGLAQCGAWCCFDEFNRIDIEVLSVIAQQLITIKNAKAAKAKKFMFEGREIKLNKSCAVFITMNPGYAGRTELPDNLKALFRPIAMMVPDYALISEVILYSEGFEEPKILAHKMVQMYKLCSEQLSQQNHYDFGMRAVKSVLVMAGSLKRASPNQREDVTLIAALRDSNLPKFLADDAILFNGIISDLFPGVRTPEREYGELRETLKQCIEYKDLQPTPSTILKCIQLYETMVVRWGVMLVGPTGGGKTSVLHSLADALGSLYENGVDGPYYRKVNIQTLNPKAVTLDELYGAVDSVTLEWQDGLLGYAVRTAVQVREEIHQWIVCDGPVDAVWIENMNTVLDDNKMLCLANSERIKLTPWIHMVFEVQDLVQASPATVSRCGMVYVDPEDLGWLPLLESWKNHMKYQLPKDILAYIFDIQMKFFDKILDFDRKGTYLIHQVKNAKIAMFCKLCTALINETKWTQLGLEQGKSFILKIFVWSILWAIGSNYTENSRNSLEEHIRHVLKTESTLQMPEESLWDYKINVETQEWENWASVVRPFKFDPQAKYFDLQVPTADTTKFGYVARLLFIQKHPVLFTGETGVGKSVLAATTMKRLTENNFVPVLLSFSSQTSSSRTQRMIEGNLQKTKRTQLSAPAGKTVIIFIDDVNMPKLDTYGSQPPIELLRQVLDFNGFYERKKLFWTPISGVLFGAACAPPGGGRNPITPRFMRHFALLSLPKPDENTLYTIFSSILQGFFTDFSNAIKALANPIANACVEVYTRIAKELLPTPDKSHYVFNLRDLSKCIQGILQSDNSNYVNETQILRLFYHETSRVFHDRLINETDKTYFKELISSVSVKYFNTPIVKPNEKILFGDFMIFGQPVTDRIYEEITNLEKLKDVLTDYMDDYNSQTGQEIKLILFENAMEHIVRMARLLRADRGNGLLVGVAGGGKQSLARLAAHINGFRCMQIELTRNYDSSAFHEDLRNIYRAAGVQNKGTVFLFPDTHIIEEDFLEDVSNILNSGEVPNLFEGDDYEKILIDVREACNTETNNECSREDIFKFFINRVRNNLHVIITMSPIGDAFRRRCRMFPSLVNCCTIDWFDPWPAEALYSVALGLLYEIEPVEETRIKLAQTSVFMHKTVEEASIRFYQELRRYYHTTPSSYLELLKLYKDLLKKRTDQIISKRKRISTGLDKIFQTNELVAVMQKDLEVLYPELENQSASMKELLAKLEVDNKNADAVKEAVSKDENIAKEKAATCQAIADDAQKDLEIAMPALREAEDALKSLNKTDINEIRAFASPPQLVQFVLEAVCILMDVKPNWASAKALMADVNFLKRLVEFDKEHIPEATLKKIKKYVEHKDFVPTKIEKVSKVAKSVCQWVIAIDKFAKVYKIVEPKIKKREAADAELQAVMQILRGKQQQLAEIEAEVQALKDKIEEKTIEFKRIQDNVDLTVTKINRAERLTSALSEEEIRWADTVKKLTEELEAAPGDVLIASACVAYLGAFSSNFREDLTQKWVEDCRNSNIPNSGDFNVVNVLGDQYELRIWAKAGLPRDQVSIENGLYATRALRWPLIIDPQEQANRWIRSLENENNLHVSKSTDGNLIRVLEMCIQQGHPLLIEDIGEKIDPTLKPILQRNTFVSDGMVFIKLTDVTISYHKNFKLYMTTKLANPHYMPEVCISVTLINFSVTPKGLEDQLLADIGAIEQPELEAQRNEMIVQINSDKQQLLILEDKVLKLLFGSKGSILDDEVLVETLNEVKETSLIIAARLVDTEETEAVITANREKYRPLASRGAILYFVIASLAEINPMYQYSLKYFVQIFCNVLRLEHPKMTTQERISQLKVDELIALHKNVSRGLFEVHKLIFTFLLATAVEKQDGHITENEYNYFIRGPVGATQTIEKPEGINLRQREWQNCQYLEENFKPFEGLTEALHDSLEISIGEYKESMNFSENSEKNPINWNTRLTPFQKLMLIKSLKNEKVTIAVAAYVRFTLGKSFTEDDGGGNLKTVYEDMSNITPLVFVLSQGSDPMSAFLKFATDMEFIEKFYSISLGQGQGPIAESYIDRGSKLGYWVFLQNCHLATSWMETLENIIRNITLGLTKTHLDYRLFLSTMPTKAFPISVLQNSVKITNEPPKGIKANVLRALAEVKEEFFERHVLGRKWRSIVFGLFMFHAVLLERRKFGPLGWNILYEFNESDRECALQILDIFIDRERAKSIPWDAIVYINGEITWGGRVTDHWDQRCLRTIMKTFCSPQILAENYSYGTSRTYRDPRKKMVKDYKKYVSSLPLEDDPEIFGMHENSSIVFQSKETDFFISTLLLGQPRSVGGQKESKEGEIVSEIIEQISKRLVKKIDTENIHPDLVKTDEKGRVPPLSTVLLQEIDRYNILLKTVHSNIEDLSKAVKGFIVMSEQLEDIMKALLINFVPDLWSSRGFLSIKNLPNWIADFERRIDFIQTWCRRGTPISFWMSGFYFPQAFLTGILQTHARQYNLPIDALKIDFEVSNVTIDQQNIFENHKLDIPESSELYNGLTCPETGVYVHGLFIEAGHWDESEGGLCDSKTGELFSRLPAIWFKPCEILDKGDRYEAPLYKTQARAGVLSTTGHSTNFVHSILLKSELKSDFWILRGTALVTAVTENLA